MFIPVYIHGDVEPENMKPCKTFSRAIAALVMKSINEGETVESGRFIINASDKEPYLENISMMEIKDAARRLLEQDLIKKADAKTYFIQ